MTTMLRALGIDKGFTLHLRGGIHLDVLRGASITALAGQCVALAGPSGTGKSTLLRSLYGNYRVDRGEILLRHAGEMVDLAAAPPAIVIAARRCSIGYVSQFLRAMPRVAALDVAAARLLERGVALADARACASAMLERLGIAPRLHALPPATFSGGEQQRVNLARTFVCHWPVLLLDEPTASLDAANRHRVIALIREAKDAGSAVIGIFHDDAVRAAVADTTVVLG